MRIFIAAMLLLFGLSGEGKAGFTDGSELHNWCQGMVMKITGCMGYIQGVIDMTVGEQYNGSCFRIPPDSNRLQAHDVVKAWLEKNPAKRHYAAQDLVAKALAEAWPCKK